jgi:hypothetical protein
VSVQAKQKRSLRCWPMPNSVSRNDSMMFLEDLSYFKVSKILRSLKSVQLTNRC